MPVTQLTGYSSVLASITGTVTASSAAGTQTSTTITIPANQPGASGQSQYYVPGNEVWAITNYYLPQGTSVSTGNERIFCVVNFAGQRIAPSEAEIQSNVYHPVIFSRAQWIILPPTQQFYFYFVNQVTSANTNTTVTVYATIATATKGLMK